MSRWFLLVPLFSLLPLHAGADGSATVVIELEGLRSDRGEVRGGLFVSEGWPEGGREIATCRARIRHHRATCVIEHVEEGLFGFAFFHDENGNGQFDRDFIGWPQEGFGFSNDAAPSLGPPSFGSASFTVEGTSTMVVHARYGL